MQQPWITLLHLRTLVLWALILPVLAEGNQSQTTNSAGVSQPKSPDQPIDSKPATPPIHHDQYHRPGPGHDLYARASDSDSTGSTFTFPTPFDTSISKNFTSSSCPAFFKSFLADSSFTSCHAVSTLLRDSAAFFHTLTSAASTSRVLDIACASDVSSCTSTMSDFASQLTDPSNCGADYEAGNPLVTNAYFDMITYEPIYRATCLQSPVTSDYCFVDAVTNTSNPADYDVYSLPYGSTIDADSVPTCGACLQATLDVFSKWAQVEGQPLADSYMPSAEAVNGECGFDFANVNVTLGVEEEVPTSSSMRLGVSRSLWAAAIGAGMVLAI